MSKTLGGCGTAGLPGRGLPGIRRIRAMYSQIFMLSIIASVAGAAEAFPTDLTTDVCVVGGGSGGIGAAVAAARGGADVILIEKQNRLGGTSTLGYVCNWEPGPGDELAKEIFDRIAKVPNAVAVTTLRNAYSAKAPYGLNMPDPAAAYEQSLKRAGLPGARRHSVVFEPEAFHNVVSAMLKETGRCRVMLQTEFVKAEADGPRVAGITAKSASGELYRIRARTFIDSTGNAALCRALGCKTMLGADAKSAFGERSAPDQPAETLNAISLCYRIRRSANPVRQAVGAPTDCGKRCCQERQGRQERQERQPLEIGALGALGPGRRSDWGGSGGYPNGLWQETLVPQFFGAPSLKGARHREEVGRSHLHFLLLPEGLRRPDAIALRVASKSGLAEARGQCRIHQTTYDHGGHRCVRGRTG